MSAADAPDRSFKDPYAKPEVLVALVPTWVLVGFRRGSDAAAHIRTGELIQRFNAQGMTIVVVEHDMAFIRQIAKQVTVLHYGKVFACGPIGEIIRDPRVAEIYLGKTHD